MADSYSRQIRAARLVRLQGLMREAEEIRLAVLQRERQLLMHREKHLLEQLSGHGRAALAGTAQVAGMLRQIAHREHVVNELLDVQEGEVRRAKIAADLAQNRLETASRLHEGQRRERASEEVIDHMLQRASLPKG